MPGKDKIIQITAGGAFTLMIIVNALANILPINGLKTGEISDSYPNLFAPAAVTFSIWGIIYLLLGVYTGFQFIANKSTQKKKFFNKINIFFIISSLLNSAWIFAWHFKSITLTVIIMLGLLLSLIKIAEFISNEKLNLGEKLFIKIPFGVYFGWITVASIANITIFLVSIGWDGFGIGDNIWMIIALILGALIGMGRMLKDQNIAYGLVFLWAYFGIWLKHTSPAGFNGNYKDVIIAVLSCMVFFIFAYVYLVRKKKFI